MNPADSQALVLGEGTTFGEYVLRQRLGTGGFGEVWLAEREHRTELPGAGERVVTKEQVALKLMLGADDPTVTLINEWLNGRASNHPNIVKLLAVGRHGPIWYVAMEYVTGRNLEELMGILARVGVKVPPIAVLELGLAVANGLHAVHAAQDSEGRHLNLVHRDIKPANLMVDLLGQVKVLDFGIAKGPSSISNTEVGTVKGTLFYMSPEQHFGKALGPPSDIFALGAVLFEALTGEVLFPYRDYEQCTRRKLDDSALQQLSRAEQVLPGITPILRRCIAAKISHRYPDALGLLGDLRGLLATQPRGPGLYELMQLITIGALPDGTPRAGAWLALEQALRRPARATPIDEILGELNGRLAQLERDLGATPLSSPAPAQPRVGAPPPPRPAPPSPPESPPRPAPQKAETVDRPQQEAQSTRYLQAATQVFRVPAPALVAPPHGAPAQEPPPTIPLPAPASPTPKLSLRPSPAERPSTETLDGPAQLGPVSGPPDAPGPAVVSSPPASRPARAPVLEPDEAPPRPPPSPLVSARPQGPGTNPGADLVSPRTQKAQPRTSAWAAWLTLLRTELAPLVAWLRAMGRDRRTVTEVMFGLLLPPGFALLVVLAVGMQPDAEGAGPTEAPETPTGVATQSPDPDPEGPDVVPEGSQVQDNDEDGYLKCAEGASDSCDCDDTQPSVHPGAVELCDGMDTDCIGGVPSDEVHSDGDKFIACNMSPDLRTPELLGGGDCDPYDDSIHPGAQERINGKDDDCNGLLAPQEQDADGDGVMQVADCNDHNASVHPGATELPGDSIDNNCDRKHTCYRDDDRDDWGTDEVVQLDIEQGCDSPGYAGKRGDCDDHASNRNPGNLEIEDDGIDNNCYGADDKSSSPISLKLPPAISRSGKKLMVSVKMSTQTCTSLNFKYKTERDATFKSTKLTWTANQDGSGIWSGTVIDTGKDKVAFYYWLDCVGGSGPGCNSNDTKTSDDVCKGTY